MNKIFPLGLLWMTVLLLWGGHTLANDSAGPRVGPNAHPIMSHVFSELRRLALSRSPDIREAEAVSDQKGAHAYTSWTQWFPRVDLRLTQSNRRDYSLLNSGQLGQLANSPAGPGMFSITPQVVVLSSWFLNLDFPVYRRSIHLGVSQSMKERELSQLDLKSRVTEVDWRLRSLLGNYLLQAYRHATRQTSIELAKQNLREARLKSELGEATRVDLLRAESNLSSLEAEELTDRQDRASALSSLLLYLDIENEDLEKVGLGAILRAEDVIDQAIEAFSEISDALEKARPFLKSPHPEQETALSESSPYQRILLTEELGDVQAKSWMAKEWPELLIQGSVNKQAESWGDAFSPGNVSHSVSLILAVPLFNWGSTISTYREESSARKAAIVKSEKSRQEFLNEIQNERNEIAALEKSLGALKAAAEQNQEIVRLSMESYRLGKDTLVDVLISQRDLALSKVNLAKTKIDLSVLLRKFFWNLGVPTV